MRWLLVKDLQVLRRSPLLVALLVIYPIAISVLFGLALSAGPERPRVAVANLADSERLQLPLGGSGIDPSRYADRLFDSIDTVPVDSREQAIDKVRSGDVLAAVLVPADFAQRLQASLSLTGGTRPTVEVFYNAEDPVKRRFVESVISARLADADKALSDIVLEQAADYIGVIVTGGSIALPVIGEVDILGLERALKLVQAARANLEPGSPEDVALGQVARFAELAADNLNVSKPILGSIGSPVEVRETLIDGSRVPLDAFAAAVSVTLSLMFVTLLLASGMLASEREEQVFGRLVRGLVSRWGLIVEKICVAALCSACVALAMMVGLGAVLGFDFGRLPLWLAALALASIAFAAMGVAIGAVAREVRTASLLAFLLSLPIAFLALVPSGAVSRPAYDAMGIVSAAFPFKPALRALDAAVNGGALLVPLGHLAVLTVAFGIVARISLRRFA